MVHRRTALMIIDPTAKPWHYELYEFGGGLDESTNICRYSRKVGVGLFLSALIIVICVFLGVLIIEPIASTTLWLIGDHPFITFFNHDSGVLIWIVDIAVLLICAAAVTSEYIGKKWRARKNAKRIAAGRKTTKPKEPGFLTTWYRSIKEKTCFLVEFKNDNS